jgi:ADP-ribose pyrophosphatase
MDIVWSGKYIEACKDGTWEYVRRRSGIGAAVILAITDAGEVILVEQFRVPLGRSCIELPAGLVGDDGSGEAAAVTANRELEEETGYRADAMVSLGEYASSPGMSSETFELFRAEGLRKVGGGGGVEGESLTVHLVPLEGLRSFLDARRAEGCFVDVKLVALLPHYAG